jgi:hypothetical protein
MSDSVVLRACDMPAASSTVTAAKAPRERLWRLQVECRSCSEALPRLFGLLARHEIIPATIDYRCEADGFAITLIIAPPDARVAALLAGRIERIVTISKVLVAPLEPSQMPAS